LIYIAGLALALLADRELHLPSLALGRALRETIAAAIIIAGVVVMTAGAGLFMRRRTAIIPYKAASRLVNTGIYGWTRNPMYLGMALTYGGVAVLLKSLGALILLPIVLTVVRTQVIAREEAYLERAFGREYLAYKSQVRRWI
jgi:protein-S-isoprenylcysteine O-methyltransferase Ste14